MGSESSSSSSHANNSEIKCIKYFDDRLGQLTNINPMNSSIGIVSSIKLDFSLENIRTGVNYSIKIIFDDYNNFNPFQTEYKKTKDSSFLQFDTCYLGDYFLEKTQKLRIFLLTEGKEDNPIEVILGKIVEAPNGCLKQNISGIINIIIKEEIIDINSYIELNFEAQSNSIFDFSYTINKISFLITSNNKKIYKSELISNHGIFKPIKIPSFLIKDQFKVTILDLNNNEIVSKNDTIDNINQINNTKNNIYLTFKSKMDNKYINIINKSHSIKKESNLMDYIRAGVKVKLIIGIDYSSNNLPINHQFCLHYLGSNKNQYEEALENCLNIFSQYISSNIFPVYGFSAILNNNPNVVNNCFNINMNLQNPDINLKHNIFIEYRKSFNYLTLSDTSKFSPLLQKVLNEIKEENDKIKYNILLLMTCGIIRDLQETIDILVEGSSYPLSVVIIGIGNGPFGNMLKLVEESRNLIYSLKKETKIDIAHFVPFINYKNDFNALTEEVFGKVSKQIIQYYNMNNMTHEDIKDINNKRINQSSVLINKMSKNFSNYKNSNFSSSDQSQFSKRKSAFIANCHNHYVTDYKTGIKYSISS